MGDGVRAVRALERMNVWMVADPVDYAPIRTDQRTNGVLTAAGKLQLLPDGSLIYIPRQKEDWVTHPKALFARDVVIYQTIAEDAAELTPLTAGSLLFLIPNSWREPLLSGKTSEKELLLELERGLPRRPVKEAKPRRR